MSHTPSFMSHKCIPKRHLNRETKCACHARCGPPCTRFTPFQTKQRANHLLPPCDMVFVLHVAIWARHLRGARIYRVWRGVEYILEIERSCKESWARVLIIIRCVGMMGRREGGWDCCISRFLGVELVVSLWCFGLSLYGSHGYGCHDSVGVVARQG